MNKWIGAIVAVGACILPACHETKSENTCTGSEVTCQNGIVSACIAGKLVESECTGNRACINNECVEVKSCSGNYTTCDNNILSVCNDGKLVETPCSGDRHCDDNQCVPNQNETPCTGDSCQPQETTCDPEDYVAKCKDNRTRLVCNDNHETTEDCINGCKNGVCQSSATESFCGNNRIDGTELCDNFDVGDVGCDVLDEFKDLPKDQAYRGRVRCNQTCDGFVNYTCEPTKCGNGIREDDELCDTDKTTGKPIHSTFPSCDQYFNASERGLQWKPGGEPSCNKNCDGYGKGTCQLEDQPRDGIKTCEFKELLPMTFDGDDNLWLQGTLFVETDDSVENLVGRLACGHSNEPTYNWSFKSDETMFSITEDPENPSGGQIMQAWLKANNWGPGTYDCVFQVNAFGGKNSYYNCPIELGYPAEQDIVDASKYRSYVVESDKIDGEVIAHWHYNNLGAKNDEVTKANADEGANAASAVFTVTTGTNGKNTLKLLTGRGSYTDNLAVSADGWSEAATIEPNAKHFTVKFNTTGYQNIRVQMYVAASGNASGNLAATYTIGNSTKNAANYTMKATDRSWEPWSFFINNAENKDVTLNLYTYANKDQNATLRIDDLYILGDKI